MAAELERASAGVAAAAVPVTKWHAAEVFPEVSGHWVAVSRALGSKRIKVEAIPLPPTDLKFQKQFGAEELRKCGFTERMSFTDCVQLIRGSLKREMSMTATLKADGSDAVKLVLKVPVAYFFSTEYSLSLTRVPLPHSDKVSVDLHVTKLQQAAAQIEIEALKQRMDATEAELELCKAENATLKDLLKKEMGASKHRMEVTETEMEKMLSMMAAMREESVVVKKELSTFKAELSRATAESSKKAASVGESAMCGSMAR